MCLAVPGKIVSISEGDPLLRKGKVSFGGLIKEVSLAYVPEAKVDDYVMVHVGFAISKVDLEEAERIFDYLREIDQLDELNPTPGEPLDRLRVPTSGAGALHSAKEDLE